MVAILSFLSLGPYMPDIPMHPNEIRDTAGPLVLKVVVVTLFGWCPTPQGCNTPKLADVSPVEKNFPSFPLLKGISEGVCHVAMRIRDQGRVSLDREPVPGQRSGHSLERYALAARSAASKARLRARPQR